jgi:cell division protein ZapE
VDKCQPITTTAGPHGLYRALLELGTLEPDSSQEHATEKLQTLYNKLTAVSSDAGGLRAWFKRLREPSVLNAPQGLYLWGGVGRGKTTLMDLFYDCLPFEHKFRVHFHRFMHEVHMDLAKVRGQEEPLALIADKLAHRARVLCFDEFEITDIGDAMILAGLLKALFQRGITLVATSNTPPGRLYENGLQRARFLPAIALLERHTDVLYLDGVCDYRPRRVERASVYHIPCNAESNQAMMDRLREISDSEPRLVEGLRIQGRDIPAVAKFRTANRA